MEGADDPAQQHKPEQQATDGKEQCCHQQPEMELSNDRQCLACWSLHDNGPASIRDGNGAEKPVLAIGSRTQVQCRMALQRLVSAWQLVQHRPQEVPGIGRGDELAVVVDDTDHKLPTLVLLRVDDSSKRNAEFGERKAGCYDADQLTAVSVYSFSNDKPWI